MSCAAGLLCAEMYGYSFGAAAAQVWHLTDHTAMLYPSYMPYTAAGMHAAPAMAQARLGYRPVWAAVTSKQCSKALS